MKRKKGIYIITVLVLAAIALSFRPGLWLAHKPANSENPSYVRGWEHGCVSGTHSYSLLYAPLMERPFIKEIDAAPIAKDSKDNGTKDQYKTGWNEGFTLCRYYESAVYELMQFAIVVATLLFIGYLVARQPRR